MQLRRRRDTLRWPHIQAALSTALVCLLAVNAEAQTTCADVGDPRGQGARTEYCAVLDPGGVGGPISLDLDGFVAPVPGDNRIDLHATSRPEWFSVTDESPLVYTTTLSWATPQDQSGLQYNQYLVQFLTDPVKFNALVDSSDAGLQEGFAWVTDNQGGVIGLEVSNRVVGSDLLPWPEGAERFHNVVRGLPNGEMVTFSHHVAGGVVVVPEPAAAFVATASLCVWLLASRRRIKDSLWVSHPI